VNFFCNGIYQFGLVADVAARADFSWHPERDARASYLRVGAKPLWIQMGADPAVYRPLRRVERSLAACFVGQRYADRDRWLAAIVRAKIPLSIFGPGWGSNGNGAAESNQREYLGRRLERPGSMNSYLQAVLMAISINGLTKGMSRVAKQAQYRRETARLTPLLAPFSKGSISFQKIADVFSAHEICLNFSNVWADGRPGSALISHVRLRDFEAPMCRTCYLTAFTDEIAEFYEPGREIETYKTAEELVDKIRFYLSHGEAAEKLRSAGYKRAISDHTWERRFEQLFREAGLDN